MAKPFHFLAGAASDGHGYLPAVTCLEPVVTNGADDNVIHWLLYQPGQQFPDQQFAVAVAETELSGAFTNPLVMASDRALATYLQTRGFVEVEVPDEPMTCVDTKALANKAGEEHEQACVDSALSNPVLQALILQTIDSQILGNDPPEARETLQRLVGQGFTPDQAKSLIGAAIAPEISDLFDHKALFNRERYVENLKKLELCRETLVKLQEGVLIEVNGGLTEARTECGSCPASACHPSWCPGYC